MNLMHLKSRNRTDSKHIKPRREYNRKYERCARRGLPEHERQYREDDGQKGGRDGCELGGVAEGGADEEGPAAEGEARKQNS